MGKTDKSLMTRTIVAPIVLVLSLGTIVAVSNFSTASLVSAQMSTSVAKMQEAIDRASAHLREGIKVLKTGDTTGALMHLQKADQILSGITSSSATTGKMHLDEGIKVLKTGDTKGALMHLLIADKILGKGS